MRKGFTVIEILVVIGITTVLSGMILTYTSKGKEQVALQIERSKVAQVITRAKTMAVSTYNQGGVPCGYGVFFDYDAQEYGIFKYFAQSCASIKTEGIFVNSPGFEKMAENTFSVPKIIRMEKNPESADMVFFTPPNPDTIVFIEGASNDFGGRIDLTTQNAGSAVIKVSTAGQITF